jgi:hypothetical protein
MICMNRAVVIALARFTLAAPAIAQETADRI